MAIPLGQVYQLARKLAKTYYYQTLYSHAKELKFKIFENDKDLTDIQINFLNYLSFYHTLNIDIATGDVDEIVKTDRIYEDAWAFYKNKKRTKNEIDKVKKSTSPDIESEKYKKSTTKFVFRRRK